MDAAPPPTALQARRLRVRGLVQGVGFRYACQRRARALGLAGWVRNRIDGSVELLIEGSPAQLDAMQAWLPGGVPGARVDALLAEPEAPAAPLLRGFEQRATE